MRAMVFRGRGRVSWDEIPDPVLREATDAVVRVDAATICETDLRILRGDVPAVSPGRVLGHEAVGTVLDAGSALTRTAVGDRVLVSCITSCGSCRSCRERRYGQCSGGGGTILGQEIDGTQAERVRVPFADHSTHPIPEHLDDDRMLMLADIVPAGYEAGVLGGNVRPGDVVVVVGAGPLGLAAVMTSALLSPSLIIAVDLEQGRLDAAASMGAHVLVNSHTENVLDLVRDLTGGLGADVAMEAVGVPDAFETAVKIVRPGGHVAAIGVHSAPALLHLEGIWNRNLTITAGLVDTSSVPALTRLLSRGRLDPTALITHRYSMDRFDDAYETVSGRDSGAIKVVVARR
ncbi:alcohol dehydrogenase catalytic domain-containing protein [Rhodococcoides corynebacterioides]|uniref:alcohol dehydrogenase catalytic domain-containing protein n=1 Tax=Rhodococcoides corynebacterioides TaxID=53972 RepID=UPI00082B13CD|nr:alcohol dehydrogenase catalytic domain-containing protein [Rhodococcus corynebacterioides]